MHSIQGKHYHHFNEVPEPYLIAFSSQAHLEETIRLQEGRILFWEEHYLHLMAAMRILRLDIPMAFTMEYLEDQIQSLCSVQYPGQPFSGLVKLRVAKSTPPTTKNPLPETYFWLSIDALSSRFSLNVQELAIDLYKDHYRLSGLFQNMNSLSSHWSSMAWVYAHENSFSDLIVLNEKKNIQGSLLGNIFIINGNKIITPSLSDGAIKSVYRQQFIAFVEHSTDYTIEENSLSPFVLQRADELFILENSKALHSNTIYRKKQFDTKATQALFSGFEKIIVG